MKPLLIHHTTSIRHVHGKPEFCVLLQSIKTIRLPKKTRKEQKCLNLVLPSRFISLLWQNWDKSCFDQNYVFDILLCVVLLCFVCFVLLCFSLTTWSFTCEDISVSKQKEAIFHPITSKKTLSFLSSLIIGWYLSFLQFCFAWTAFLQQKYFHLKNCGSIRLHFDVPLL